jgi:hypothetical protein
MHHIVAVTAAICLMSTPAAAQIQYGESVPVQLESQDALDPCSLGKVVDLGADSSAMIFTGPSSDYDVVDYINSEDLVWVCQDEGGMFGVIYSKEGEQDCEVATAQDFAVNYSGPCASGWIKSEWVEITAG